MGNKKHPDDQLPEMQNSKNLPTEYGLLNSYPNPGNPGTHISFQLPEAGQVMLKVVNIRGSVVRTLVNRQQQAGVHSVYWDGCNDRGDQVSTGMYIFVLQAGGKVFNKKFSLVK